MSAVAVQQSTAAPRAVAAPRGNGKLRIFVWGGSFPLAVFVLWEALTAANVLNPMLFSRPSAIFTAGWQQVVSGAFLQQLQVSLTEMIAGFLISAILGLGIGLAMGVWRRVDYVLEPLVIGLYSAPIVALYPLLIIWVGLGFTAMITLVVLFTIFPIMVNTSLGVRLADPVLIRTARSFGATPNETLLKVILPAAMPSILAGLRLAMGRALIGMVVAELFMGSAGLGFQIGAAAGSLRTADVFWGIFVVGALGVGLASAMETVENRILRYSKA